MSNGWPEDLLEVLSDSIFDDVRPLVQRITTDERIQKKIDEVRAWIDENGREPMLNSKALKEKLLATSLRALKEQGLWE